MQATVKVLHNYFNKLHDSHMEGKSIELEYVTS
jgi:hypothetical protein